MILALSWENCGRRGPLRITRSTPPSDIAVVWPQQHIWASEVHRLASCPATQIPRSPSFSSMVAADASQPSSFEPTPRPPTTTHAHLHHRHNRLGLTCGTVLCNELKPEVVTKDGFSIEPSVTSQASLRYVGMTCHTARGTLTTSTPWLSGQALSQHYGVRLFRDCTSI